MGKRGSWFSALKKVFSSPSKEKLVNSAKETEKKGVKEKKKWGLGRLRHGEAHSFIPLYREPSSIEKILGDAEKEHQLIHGLISRENEKPHALPPREQQQPHPLRLRLPLPLPSSLNHERRKPVYQHVVTQSYHHIAAIKIQTAFRGYMARRSFRALKGLVRLQGVLRGQNVRRQMINAMKFMQLNVRVQQHIHSRRVQMMENQALQRRNLHKSDKDFEGKWTNLHFSESEPQDWDDSILTKDEMDARMQRKVEAVIKRERALAYAYSHQLWKGTPKSTHATLMEIRSGGFPWWWNWLERQFPVYTPDESTAHAKDKIGEAPKDTPERNARPLHKPHLNTPEIMTPRSLKPPTMEKVKHMTPSTSRVLQLDSPTPFKHTKTRARGEELSVAATPRDDESLTSCPPFSVPNYMVPTISAKAKVRACSTPKERLMAATPKHDSKKRLSFPFTQGIGSLRWNKASIFSGQDSSSQRMLGDSIGDFSVDSTLSLPVGVGRKPFK